MKMQSDWSHLIRGDGTTRCIALLIPDSLPATRESGYARIVAGWGHATVFLVVPIHSKLPYRLNDWITMNWHRCVQYVGRIYS